MCVTHKYLQSDYVSGGEESVFADSAYASEKTNAWLAARDIENGVLVRAYRNKKVADEYKEIQQAVIVRPPHC